jgi:hypothetical protein
MSKSCETIPLYVWHFLCLFREDVHKVFQSCCQLTGEEARKITVFDYYTVKDPAEVNTMKQKLREYLYSPEVGIDM